MVLGTMPPLGLVGGLPVTLVGPSAGQQALGQSETEQARSIRSDQTREASSQGSGQQTGAGLERAGDVAAPTLAPRRRWVDPATHREPLRWP